jgi:SAM-dependent methyltransferase
VNPAVRAVARGAVRTANTPIAKARTARALAAAPRPLKLEIGGLTPRPGWFVTNVSALARNYLDATRRWPLEDGSLEFVYADNVIEHITLPTARVMLAEAYRCLEPGGVIRLVTPDIRAHVELYLAGAGSLDTPAAAHYRDMGLTVEHPIDLVRIPIGSFGHHAGYVYDLDTLDQEFKRAGFHSTLRCRPGASEHPARIGLDQRGHEGGAQLAVEATR